MDDLISRQAAIDAVTAWLNKAINPINQSKYNDGEIDAYETALSELKKIPSAQPEWNNHTVACLLAELYADTCACNYNDIDEWLPEKCELLGSCPNPVGVACWEQFLKHKAERKSE